MRANLAIFILIFSISTSNQLLAQNDCETHLNFKFKDCKLEEILDSIERLANLRFSYNSEIVPKSELVSFSSNDLSVCIVLDSLLSPFNLLWTRVENQIVITSKGKALTPADIAPDIPSFIQVSGKVIDNLNQEPIPYAYIRILGKNAGTIVRKLCTIG